MKKFKLSGETKTVPWVETVLHRIVATTTFTLSCGLTINEGDVGGWIEKESNLSDNAWVSDNAQVFDDAKVSGNSHVFENAQVFGNSHVSDNSRVYGNSRVSENSRVYNNAWVFGDTQVFGNSQVYGDACLSGNSLVLGNSHIFGNARVSENVWLSGNARIEDVNDYIVFKNNWSSDYYLTWTKSNDKWVAGCFFYGTGDELIKKAYADSEDSGKHYEAYVKLVETLKDIHIT